MNKMTKNILTSVTRRKLWDILDNLPEPLALDKLAKMVEPHRPRKNLCGMSKMARSYGYEVQQIEGRYFIMPSGKKEEKEEGPSIRIVSSTGSGIAPIPRGPLFTPHAADQKLPTESNASIEERVETLVNGLLDCAQQADLILKEWKRIDIGRLFQFEAAVRRLVKEKGEEAE